MFNSILDNTFFDMLCEDFNEELDSYEDSLVENAFLAWDVDLNSPIYFNEDDEPDEIPECPICDDDDDDDFDDDFDDDSYEVHNVYGSEYRTFY